MTNQAANEARPDVVQRILFIDDDPDHLSLVQALVEQMLGVIVEIATTSHGAEQLLNDRCYDVVICDVSLRGEDGITICKRLKEYDPEQPLLILTGYDGLQSVTEDAERIGVPVYSKLEVSDQKFIDLLRALLSRRPCVPHASRVTTTILSEGDSEAKTLSRRPIQLTSPCLAAARAAFKAA